MTVYKHFLKMIWQRKIGTVIFLAIFLCVSFMTMQPKNRDSQNFSETPLDICIADKDHSPLSEQLTAYLQTKHTVTTANNAIRRVFFSDLIYNLLYLDIIRRG